MVTLDDDPTAVLVIRVWLEGETEQFRSRLTSTGSALGDEVSVAVASSPREAKDAVSQWLQDFLGDAAKRIDSG
jgi:hypothetical protein